MARRVPKPLVPVLVAIAGAGLAIGAALPSFAGPIITPPADVPQATPSAGTPSQPAAINLGPKDCSDCGVPPQ